MPTPPHLDYPIVAVGDVHGQRDELVHLVDRIQARPTWRDAAMVFLGDLVDRGPDPKGVIELVLELLARPAGGSAVRGNHDHALVRAARLDGGRARRTGRLATRPTTTTTRPFGPTASRRARRATRGKTTSRRSGPPCPMRIASSSQTFPGWSRPRATSSSTAGSRPSWAPRPKSRSRRFMRVGGSETPSARSPTRPRICCGHRSTRSGSGPIASCRPIRCRIPPRCRSRDTCTCQSLTRTPCGSAWTPAGGTDRPRRVFSGRREAAPEFLRGA